MDLAIRLLGAVELIRDGTAVAAGGPTQRAVLAMLALHAGQPVSIDDLVDGIWGERDAAPGGRATIWPHISRIRAVLRDDGHQPLATVAGGYRLDPDGLSIDTREFERRLDAGRGQLADGEATAARTTLDDALALWHGPALLDVRDFPFAAGIAARYDELRIDAAEERIEARLAAGEARALLPELRALIGDNPYRERLRGQLMLALYRAGQQRAALDAYQAARRCLADELGIEPSADLQQLEQAILRHDPALEAPVVKAADRASGPAPGGAPAGPTRQQRKTVSVLVARITPAGQGEPADPEARRLAMERCFEVMQAAIERHGGRAERFGDDATLGIFGVPAVHEDDALRAVRAAVELRDALGSPTQAPTPGGGVTLELRVGVDTGQVLTGVEASPVTGQVISVAAELGQVAQAGEILLGAATVRRLGPAVEAEPHVPVAVRGRSEPVAAFRLQGLVATALEIGRPMLDHAFVGRVAELETLRVAFEQAVAERGPRLVTVVGEPGIGKTRLLAEFTSGLAGTVRVVGGRCLQYGNGITYWPLTGILRDLGGPDALADWVAADAQGQQMQDIILGAVGVAEQVGSVEEAQWAIRRLFEALGHDDPLVVVLDDLHWAEPTFLQLVEYLASCSSGAPILLLATARDELFETRPAWAVPQPNAQLLPLGALAEQEAQALIDHATPPPELSEARRAQIADAAAGNPLFLEQLVAHQAEGGSPPDELVLPPTIETLLAARLDRLPTAERDLLERAAVEGMVFHRGAVSALLPADERAEAGAQLLSAIRRNLVRPHPADLPGEDGFRFIHVLVHDAVYGSMPKALRADLHERFADWLEEHGTTLLEQDELLGYHLERAARYQQELGLPDAALAERAGARLAAAGRRAFWRMDHRPAASLLGRALALTRPIRRDTHLEVELVYAVGFSAPHRAVAIAEAAAAQAQAAGDEPGAALARVAGAYFRVWNEADPNPPVDELEALARAALPLLEQTGDHAGLVNVWWAVAMVANFRDHLGELIEAHEQALRHARIAGLRGVYPTLYPAFGAALLLGPMPADEALRKVDRLLPDHPSDWLRVVRAGLLAMLDRFEDAWSIGDDASARLRERLGDRAEVELILGLIAGLAAEYEAAAEHLRRANDIWEQQREPGDPPAIELDLGRMFCALGRYDEAEPIARLGREFGAQDERGIQMQWRQVQALVDADRGEHIEAEALAREAVAIAEQTDWLYRQAEALYDLGVVLRAAGKHPEAAGTLARALDRCERKKILPMARQVRALLANEPAAAV